MSAINYHMDYDKSSENYYIAKVADELMISNMLAVLNNPTLVKMLNDAELATMLKTVKEHTMISAELALNKQKPFENRMGKIR